MQGGTALATAIAAPVGSYLGGIIGWRGALFRLEADHLYQNVIDYQLHRAGTLGRSVH